MPLTVAKYLLLGGWLLETAAPNSNPPNAITVVPCQPLLSSKLPYERKV